MYGIFVFFFGSDDDYIVGCLRVVDIGWSCIVKDLDWFNVIGVEFVYVWEGWYFVDDVEWIVEV